MLFDADSGGPGLARALEDLQRAHERGGRGGLHDHHPVGPRREHEARADSEPAGDRRRPSSPGARGHAQSRRARDRDRRRARGASPGAADRLRRRRRESVSGVRDARRHDSRRHAAGPDAREGGQELYQGAEQGRPEGDVEDGHLDAAELSRRADLRGRRPREGFRRSLLHAHGVAHRRRRHRRDRRRSARAARAGVPAASGRRAAIWTKAASISGAATASSISSIPTPSTSCSTRRAAASTRSTRNTRRR